MRIYDIRSLDGAIIAFEVNNFCNWRMGVIRIIAKIPGACITWRPSLTWFSPDVFCKFKIDDIEFGAYEPFGDSNRFWIGPNPARWVAQLDVVREAFLRGKWYGP
jgi:hypothetical protein